MKINKKIPLAILAAFTFGAVVTSTVAWFENKSYVQSINLTGESQAAYFAGGDGSSDNPYILNAPNHLYNLAWLQYMGYFNDNSAGSYIQTYFKVEADLDMTGWVLPPIGTITYPFIGNFNGGGYTISNLTVSNELNSGEITKKPSAISSLNGLNIVGMFGVIGDIDGSYEGTYDTSAVSISNFYLDSAVIRTQVNDTLIGLVAGYVNGPLSNVGVINSDVYIKSGASTFDRFESLSSYALVGYCESDYLNSVTKSITDFSNYTSEKSTFTVQETGADSGWGGSIGMDEVFNRLEKFRDSRTKVQVQLPREVNKEYHTYVNGVEDLTKYRESYLNAQNVDSYEYFDQDNPLQGRVVFGQTQENYLWGKRSYNRGNYTITNEYITQYDVDAYYLLSDGYYFYGTNNVDKSKDEANRTMLFADNNGWIYYTYNNSNYYLYANSNTDNTLRVSTNMQDYMFKVSGSNLRLYQRSNSRAQNRYVYFNNADKNEKKKMFAIQGNASNILFSTTTTKSETRTESYVDHQISHYTHGTFLPLNVYKDASEILATDREKLPGENLVVNGAKLTNTGYIVGGTKDQSESYGSGVRVASNYDYGDISKALGGDTSYNGSNLQILTRTRNSNGVVFIKDKYNANTALSTDLRNLTYAGEIKYTPEELGLQRFDKSRDNLDTQFKANTNTLYCMRFNEFAINKDNTVTAEKVLLNGTIYENYDLPESCIDFNIKDKGYINFFGGSYRGGTCDAFFSLYHVIRNSSNGITSLKRMSKIYGSSNSKAPYIYQYVDGTYAIYDKDTGTYSATTLLDGYSVYFDLEWVEEPGFTNRDYTCWYFEIPVNEGEYALGSAVNSRTSTGAYLFYLDVAANAASVDRTEIHEHFERTELAYEYPMGVSLVSSNTDTVDATDSACVEISSGYSGTLGLSRSADEITIDRTGTNAIATFGGDSLSLKDNNDVTIDVVPAKTLKTVYDRLTYIDYLSFKKEQVYVIITDITVFEDDDRTGTRTRTIQKLNQEREEADDILIYDEQGHVVEDVNAITFDTSACNTLIASFNSYYDSSITVEYIFDLITALSDDTDGTYFDITGYDITITVSGDIVVHVTFVDSECTFIINSTESSTGTDIDISLPAEPEEPINPVEP